MGRPMDWSTGQCIDTRMTDGWMNKWVDEKVEGKIDGWMGRKDQ